MPHRWVLLWGGAPGFRGCVGFEGEGFGLGPVEFFAPVCESFFKDVIRRWEFRFGGNGSSVICEFEVAENVFFAVIVVA